MAILLHRALTGPLQEIGEQPEGDLNSAGRWNTLEAAFAEGVSQMKQRPRIYYTQTQKALMWERWKKGESVQQITQLFGRNHSSVHRILAETGGIRPPERCRSRLACQTCRHAPNISSGAPIQSETGATQRGFTPESANFSDWSKK